MPRLPRTIRSLPLLVALALLGGSAPPPDDLDAFVAEQMARRHIAGLSLAVVQGGRIVTARAYGVTDRGGTRAVDTTTLFQAGSISKPVASIGALRLVEQGKLSLDADVNRSLTSWHVPATAYTATTPVTLRALLSHTAGLTVHGFPGYDVDSVRPSLVQVLDGAPPANTAPVRNDTTPGARWKYSGGGMSIMQQMVVDVTGRPFPAYMHDAVLAPLGMARSSYEQPLPAALAARTAAGHYADGIPVHGRWHVYPEMAAAGLWTTPSDLARFAIGVQRAYAGEVGAIVSQATARAYLTEVMGGYGLGVGVAGSGADLRFSHGGRDEGFDASLVATASTGKAYAIMINANDDSRLMGRIGAFIARKYDWPNAPTYRAPNAVTVAPARVESVAGLYESGGGGFLTLVARDGHLFTSVAGGVDEEFVATADDRFASVERNLQLEVRRDASGAVVDLTQRTPTASRTLPRLGPLLRNVTAGPPLGATAAARAEGALRALAVGGDAMGAFDGLTPGARADFGRMTWPPVAGLRAATLVGVANVAAPDIVRHGGTVARVAYYRVTTASGERRVIVYLTKDDLVTDVDVIDE